MFKLIQFLIIPILFLLMGFKIFTPEFEYAEHVKIETNKECSTKIKIKVNPFISDLSGTNPYIYSCDNGDGVYLVDTSYIPNQYIGIFYIEYDYKKELLSVYSYSDLINIYKYTEEEAKSNLISISKKAILALNKKLEDS